MGTYQLLEVLQSLTTPLCRAGVGNLFTITGHTNDGLLSLAGRKNN